MKTEKSKPTSTPWRLSEECENSPRDVRGPVGEIVCTTSRQRNVTGCASNGPETAEANAALIVECVNECAALRAERDELIAERSFAIEGIRTLRAERDELRAALKKALKVLTLGFDGGDEDTILILRSTLQHAANDCRGALAKEGK